MRIFKSTKLIVALSASLALLSACDSKKAEEDTGAVQEQPAVAEPEINTGSNDGEIQTLSAVEEPSAASNFQAANYSDISQVNGAGAIAQLFVRLAARDLNDEEFAIAHNIEGAGSTNAFDHKAAMEKVPLARQVAEAYNAPAKLVVSMVPGNLSSQLRTEENVTTISTDGLKLLAYDFDKKAFPYTYAYDQSCQVADFVHNNIPPQKDFIRTGDGGFNGEGVNIKVDRERMMEKTCYFPVADEAVAATIERARTDGKVAFTGKAYMEAKGITWFNRGSNDVTTSINANLDSEELYLHTIEADGSLSAPLSENKYVFS